MPEGTENLQETPQTMGSALSALEGLAGSELIAAEMKNQNPGDDNNEVQEQQEEQPKNQNGEAGDQNEVDEVVEDKNKVSADQEDDLSEEEKNNPLLTAIKGKKGPEVKFENIDQVKAHAKKHLGIEIKSENDFGKLFNSATEWRKKAQKAERDSIKYMQCIYMSERVGKVYKGIVTSVTDYGLFVEIAENKCEGLVRLSEIGGDTFIADTDNYCVKGFNTGEKIRLGDEVMIVVKSVDVEKKNINFTLIRA
jgi:RecJ-like exonuclease